MDVLRHFDQAAFLFAFAIVGENAVARVLQSPQESDVLDGFPAARIRKAIPSAQKIADYRSEGAEFRRRRHLEHCIRLAEIGRAHV